MDRASGAADDPSTKKRRGRPRGPAVSGGEGAVRGSDGTTALIGAGRKRRLPGSVADAERMLHRIGDIGCQQSFCCRWLWASFPSCRT